MLYYFSTAINTQPSVTMMTRIKYIRPKSINLAKFHFQGMHKIDGNQQQHHVTLLINY